MLLSKKNRVSININEAILLLLSVTYAGISSNIFFGFRLVDILVFLFFVIKLKKKIDPNLFFIFGLWLLSIGASFIVGILYKAPFIASDLRFFSVFIFVAYLGYVIGIQSNINMRKLFYWLMGLTLFIYCIIPLFDFLRFYYIPKEFQKDEHIDTVFGPSTIIINYIYVYLVLINKNRSFWFYTSYLTFAILIYSFRISRTDLALMVLFFLWSIIYRFGELIRLKHLLFVFSILIVGSISLYINDNERIIGLFNPSEDSSFVYRILSNNEFLRQFSDAPFVHKAFGFGIGATLYTHFNDWFGTIILTILDNGPLTVLMKLGFFGLLGYVLVFYYPIRGFLIKTKLVIVFPVILSMALFSHTIYNLLYVFGFYLISFKLKSVQNLK